MKSSVFGSNSLETSQNSVLGIKTNIPNTVSVLGILFQDHDIRYIIPIIQETVLGILFQYILLGILYLLSNNWQKL